MGNRKITYDEAAIRKLWEEGLPQHDICIQLGIKTGTFWHIKKLIGLPRRESDRVRSTTFYWGADPSPEEIAERAAAERAKWTPQERAKRERWMRPPVELQSYEYNGVHCTFSGLD